jgi:hypothetical protein
MSSFCQAALVLPFVAAGLPFAAVGDPAEKVERTTNQQKDWFEPFFRKAAISLSIDSTGAHFRTRRDARKFCLGAPREPMGEFQFEFTLSKPGEVFYSPDHHGMMIFTVKRITADAIVIGYESSFDHRSFGKNLVTKDEGEFTLHPFTNE